jgi:hypothetical protein
MTIQELSMLVERETLDLSIKAAKTLDHSDLAAAFAAKCEAWRKYTAILLGTVAGLESLVASQDAILDEIDAMASPAADDIADDPWVIDLSKALTSGVYEFTLTKDIIARERAGRDQ